MKLPSPFIIFKAASRSPWPFAALVVEVALTMAVVINVNAVVRDNISVISTPTGVPEHRLAVIQSIQTNMGSSKGSISAALNALRSTPGVRNAALGDAPLWNVQRVPISTQPTGTGPTIQAFSFAGSQGLCDTLGLSYVTGRPISDIEIPEVTKIGPGTEFPVVITEALGKRLYGDTPALGRHFYVGSQSTRVVGVVAHLMGTVTGNADDDYSFVLEYRLGSQDMGGGFVLDISSTNPKSTLASAAMALQAANPNHVQKLVQTMDDLRTGYFSDRLFTARVLLGVALILIIITIGGIAGLGAYWVHQRRRQIGIRRAVGATRFDIVLYFMTENIMIVGAGVILGGVGAILTSSYMTLHFNVPHIEFSQILAMAAVLIAVGQFAVIGPALRSSKVSPAQAVTQ